MPDRVVRLPGATLWDPPRRIFYDRLTEAQRAEVDVLLAQFFEAVERNPLEGFEPHSVPQREFLLARTPVVAAQAGNRFGKTTALVVRGAIECLPVEMVPERLRPIKRFEGVVHGWIVCPTEDKIEDTFKPAFRQWIPRAALRGGSVDKAWNGERNTLTFANGSLIALKTYKQAADTLESAAVHWVAYDEPPPREHREACLTRLLDFDGYEMFAYTPLASNTGYVRREIFKKRASPDITLIRGSMHDNPRLNESAKARVLGTFNDLWRRAREFGDFVDVGGLIYEQFEQRVIPKPKPADLNPEDIAVGIDPGVRNCGIVFASFDSRNVCTFFDEVLLQDKTVEDYAKAIWEVLGRWGLMGSSPLFVIDSQAAAREPTDGGSVLAALAILGIGCVPCPKGPGSVEAGIQQVRSRLQHERLLIAENCVGLRDEADEYAAEDRPDGEFKPIKQNDHRLDAGRYICMVRPWFPQVEARAVEDKLGFRPDHAIPGKYLTVAAEQPPMGSMS